MKDLKIKYEPTRKGDILHSCADIQSISRDLGYKPVVEFKEGLKKTVDWWLRRGNKNV